MTAGAIAAPRSGIASAKQFGIAGVVFAAVAWVITLPPFLVRSPAPSLVLAVLALGAGAAAAAGEERRLGFGAIALGRVLRERGHVVPGPPLSADPDRRRRDRRALASAGVGRDPILQGVTGWR